MQQRALNLDSPFRGAGGMKVTIIGGGVIGLCSAYYLQKDGHDITVIDRGDISEIGRAHV